MQVATKGTLPNVDWSLIAVIAGLAAIAGNGGLTNTPISNFTRDQGWGMGHHVGAIPSMVGGQGITLSHVGRVFDVTAESLPRWRKWYNHVVRDQTLAWMVACFIGVGLPSVLSVGQAHPVCSPSTIRARMTRTCFRAAASAAGRLARSMRCSCP